MVSDFRKELLVQKVCNYIKKKGDISRSELSRHFSHSLTSKGLSEIIDSLVNAKVVGERMQQTHKPRGRQSKTVYFSLPKELEVREVISTLQIEEGGLVAFGQI